MPESLARVVQVLHDRRVTTAPDAATTVGELGELGLIAELTARLPTRSDVLLGPGDDAAVLAFGDARVVATTDLLVEGNHFRRDWSSAADIGHKAAAQNIMDVVAMGARPRSLLLGLALPTHLPVAWLLELVDGMCAECDLVDATVVGGDIVSSSTLVVSVTALGELADEPLTRAGASPGEVVAIQGRLGWSAAGYAVVSRGFRSPRAVVDVHRRPAPPYEGGAEARRLGATSLIDLSDGLLTDLGRVAAASGVSIDIDSGVLEVAEPLQAVGAALNLDPLAFVLTGGEDHGLAATFPADRELPPQWQVVGRVTGDGEIGVTVDGSAYTGDVAGFDHFKNHG